MWPNTQETADLIKFTEEKEILNGKRHFLCSGAFKCLQVSLSLQIFKYIWQDFDFGTTFAQILILMVNFSFKLLRWNFTPGYSVLTSGYLVVTSSYLIATTGYFSLLLVTSHYFSLLLVPRFSNNGKFNEIHWT